MKTLEKFDPPVFLWVRTPVIIHDSKNVIFEYVERIEGYLYPVISFSNIQAFYVDDKEEERYVICPNNEFLTKLYVEVKQPKSQSDIFTLLIDDEQFSNLLPELARVKQENVNVVVIRAKMSDDAKKGLEEVDSLTETPFTGLFYCDIDKLTTENGATFSK